MTARRLGPLVVLLLVCALVAIPASDARPSARDDEVFLLASYIAQRDDVRPVEAITRAVAIQYEWGGPLAERLRERGDIQTYALVPVWARIGGFEVKPSPYDRPLYVESSRIQRLSFALFAVTIFVLYWAVRPLGRGVALAAAVVLAVGHPFRQGPALFDPWVMPLAVAAIGCFLRQRHLLAIALAVAATMVKPNYLFLLPAFAVASLVPATTGEPPARRDLRTPLAYGAGVIGVAVAYLALAAVDVIAFGEYTEGVRGGYDPGVLAYSAVETISFTYRAGVQQFRQHWPIFPWTILNGAALLWLLVRAARAGRMRRTTVLLMSLIAIPLLANFMVISTVGAYEDGGHFRWVNVSILAMAIALPVAYREVIRTRA